MPKFIIFSSFMLFWVFYEMSGGADFVPQERQVVSQAPWLIAPHAVASRPTTAAVVQSAAAADINTTLLAPLPASLPATPTVTEPQIVVARATAQDVLITPSNRLMRAKAVRFVAQAPAVAAPTAPAVFVLVAGSRVNLRAGPGTGHAVLDTLPQGTRAELVTTNDDGWAQIKLTDAGTIGWMAQRLLSDG